MEPPKYNGTVHPEEWVQQVRTFCFLNNKTNPENELQFCEQLIHPAIKIPSINNTQDLLDALKSHDSFNIFKESCKRKLLTLKYIDGDVAAFLANFQSLCYNAEINDIEEIKDIIYKIMVSNEYFNAEFAKRSKEINSMEKSLKLFSDIIADEANFIKRFSCVTIKHAATGKYLSSLPGLLYETGSSNQVVFAGETFPGQNALWIVTPVNQYVKSYTNFVFYDNDIYLTHKLSDKRLIFSHNDKSPLSNYSEVSCYLSCYNFSANWKLKRYNSTNNNDPLVRSQDRIILQDINNNKILRSQELKFTIDNKSLQEVICHDERIGENDEWIIELVEDHHSQVPEFVLDSSSRSIKV